MALCFNYIALSVCTMHERDRVESDRVQSSPASGALVLPRIVKE